MIGAAEAGRGVRPRTRLPWRPSPGPPLIGLEHEYYLHSPDGPVDFRDLIHGLPLDGRRMDPGDTNAYRLRSGLAVTADDAEAEISSPPEPLRPGFTARLAGWAGHGREVLAAALPPKITLEGASTHISVSCDDRRAEVAAEFFARRFSPAYMLVAERSDSLGIMVRPRNGRLEVCSEFAEGKRLRAASALAAGAALACGRAARGKAASALPPPVDVLLRPCRDRAGVIVRREAFGSDLYAGGRQTLLRLEDGRSITAGEHLELAWEAAREALEDIGAAGDAAEMGLVVAGRLPLGVEGGGEPLAADGPIRLPRSDFNGLLDIHRRPGFSVRAGLATWDFTVFDVAGAGRLVYACVPRDRLESFLANLKAGRLDRELGGRLALAPNGRVLASYRQTGSFGVYDELGSAASLLTPERGDPRRAGASDPGSTSAEFQFAMAAALSKAPPVDDGGGGDTSTGGGGPGRLIWIAGGLTLALIPMIIALIIILTGGGKSDEPLIGVGESPSPGQGQPVESPGSTGGGDTTSPAAVATSPPAVATSPAAVATSPAAVAPPSPAVAAPSPAVAAPSPAVAAPSPAVPAPSPPVSTSPPAVATSPPPVVLSGNRTVAFTVKSNLGNHPCAVPSPIDLNFFITRDRSVEPNPVSIRVTGLDTVTMNGATVIGPSFDSQGGTASAAGIGTYCNFTTSYQITFTITPTGVSGTLTIGGDGALPGGQPLVLTFTGGAPH